MQNAACMHMQCFLALYTSCFLRNVRGADVLHSTRKALHVDNCQQSALLGAHLPATMLHHVQYLVTGYQLFNGQHTPTYDVQPGHTCVNAQLSARVVTSSHSATQLELSTLWGRSFAEAPAHPHFGYWYCAPRSSICRIQRVSQRCQTRCLTPACYRTGPARTRSHSGAPGPL